MARKILTPEEIQNFDKYLYSLLPDVYRYTDATEGKYTLSRFLDTLNEGGFATVNNQIVGLLHLSQVRECPEEYLGVLANTFGCDWVDEIPMRYRRKLIELLIPLYKKKGTLTSIEYLAKELSGFAVKVIENEIPDEYFEEGDELKRLFTIKLLAPEIDDPIKSKESEVTITKIISHFVPVHSKYIVLVSYFYNDEHKVTLQEDTAEFIKEFRGVDFKVMEGDCTMTDNINYSESQSTNFTMFTDPDLAPINLDTVKLYEGQFNKEKGSIVETAMINKLKTVDATSREITRNTSKTDKVMVKCILREPDTKVVGLYRGLFKTCSYDSKLSSLDTRLSIPGRIEKITTSEGTKYIYE